LSSACAGLRDQFVVDVVKTSDTIFLVGKELLAGCVDDWDISAMSRFRFRVAVRGPVWVEDPEVWVVVTLPLPSSPQHTRLVDFP